jgi:light-regulated signal transduction histidine kinase (bacteriophytochrome)
MRMDSSSQSEADAARAELQHFVYAASHDLQEPLRAIVSYSQLLERHLAGDETARDYIAYIIGGANRMNALLRDLLTLSRAGSTQRRAVVNLNVAAQAALLKLAPAIADVSAEIKRESLPEVFADEAEITQLFEHLIGNALKFRGAAKPVIAIRSEQGSGEYVISVADNGFGIEPAFQQEVFAAFKRLQGKGVPGSGLGLAISKKIVDAHSGRIWIESDGHSGTTVKFTLPDV